LLKELDDKRKLANCLLITSFLQANREDGGAAVDTAEEAKALFQELNDRKGEGIAQYISIYANLAKEDNEAAVTAAGEAQTIFQAIGNKRWEADSLVALGLCKCVSEEFDAGIENATKVEQCLKKLVTKKEQQLPCCALLNCTLRTNHLKMRLPWQQMRLASCAN